MKSQILMIALALAFALATRADEKADVKARLEGYVQTMMSGERANILEVQDYYSPVYLTEKATIESIKARDDGSYEAVIKFDTVGKVFQDAESSKLKKQEVKEKTSVRKTVVFKSAPQNLKWQTKLDVPFVKPGFEKRYVLEDAAKKTSASKKK